MNPVENGYQEIVADIPYMELYGYNTDLRSMTEAAEHFLMSLHDTNRHLPIFRRRKLPQEHPNLKSQKSREVPA